MIKKAFDLIPIRLERRVMIDATWFGKQKPTIYGLVEFDVTQARAMLAARNVGEDEKISFTAFIAYCIAQAIEDFPEMNSYRNWRDQRVVFADVDIAVVIEVLHNGELFPMSHVVRAANRRTIAEISNEIYHIKRNYEESPSRQEVWAWARYFLRLPAFIRRLVYRVGWLFPTRTMKMMGTVGLTSVGMFADIGGWGIALPIYSLAVTIGGIEKKAVVRDDQIVIREMLNITFGVDHRLIDGGPATRFMMAVKALVETGAGIN